LAARLIRKLEAGRVQALQQQQQQQQQWQQWQQIPIKVSTRAPVCCLA
jgi:hypothetical protein